MCDQSRRYGGVGAGDGDSVSWSSVPRFLPSLDLAMTIWAFRASCSRDFILQGGGNTVRWGPVNPPRMGLGIDRPTERTGPTGEPIYPSCVWLDPSYWDVPGEDYPGAVDWEDDPSIDQTFNL